MVAVMSDELWLLQILFCHKRRVSYFHKGEEINNHKRDSANKEHKREYLFMLFDWLLDCLTLCTAQMKPQYANADVNGIVMVPWHQCWYGGATYS